jgi:methionyl-tRNA formyltransferase
LEVLYEGKKIKIFKPKKIKNNQKFYQELKNLNPDYFVVISYGKILPKEILEIPRFGPINLH